MKPRGRRRSSFVPEIVFTTLCATTVIPACGGSGSDTGKKDAGTGGFQGVAAGGFAGMSVAAGGFGGASVAAGGFGGMMAVAAGGFGGMSVAAGGFGGASVAAGGFGGFSVADAGFGGTPPDASLDAMNDVELGNWAVTDAFGDFATRPRRSPSAARGKSKKKRARRG